MELSKPPLLPQPSKNNRLSGSELRGADNPTIPTSARAGALYLAWTLVPFEGDKSQSLDFPI
jgi:hypothetical protein